MKKLDFYNFNLGNVIFRYLTNNKGILIVSFLVSVLSFALISCSGAEFIQRGQAPHGTDTPPESNENPDSIFEDDFEKPVPTSETQPTPNPNPLSAYDPHDNVVLDIINKSKAEFLSTLNVMDYPVKTILFGRQIYRIDFIPDDFKPKLKMTLYSRAQYNFDLVSSDGYSYDFSIKERPSNDDSWVSNLINPPEKVTIFTAHVEMRKTLNKTIAIITIQDLRSEDRNNDLEIPNPMDLPTVRAIYAQRLGKVYLSQLLEGDYKKLSRGSKKYLQSIEEKPYVVGEFYYLLTSNPDYSPVTRFNIVLSRDTQIKGNTHPINFIEELGSTKVPISTGYLDGYWGLAKSILPGYNHGYTYIQSARYLMTTEKENPTLLRQMTLEFLLKGDNVQDQKQKAVPVHIDISFGKE